MEIVRAFLCALVRHRPRPLEAPEGTMWAAYLRSGPRVPTPVQTDLVHVVKNAVPLRVITTCTWCGAWRIPDRRGGVWVRRTGDAPPRPAQ